MAIIRINWRSYNQQPCLAQSLNSIIVFIRVGPGLALQRVGGLGAAPGGTGGRRRKPEDLRAPGPGSESLGPGL